MPDMYRRAVSLLLTSVVSLLLTKAQYLELDEHIFPYSFLNVEYTSSPRGVRILAGTNI